MSAKSDEMFDRMVGICGGNEVLAVDFFCRRKSPEQARLELQDASKFSRTSFVQEQKLLERRNLEADGKKSQSETFWQAVEARMTETGCGKGSAVRFVVSEQPGLHEKFLREKESEAVSLRAAR